MRPSIIVDKWGIKTNSLLGYAVTTDDFYVAREFSYTRAGTTPGTLIDASGNLVYAVLNTPRIDYTGGSPSLLVEPAATNQIRNNSMVGAVTGSPGTLPTNWTIPAAAGLTREIVGIGTENGISYIDIKLSGTATGTETEIRLESPTQIVAANGQTWTESIYLKSISQPAPPVSYRLFMIERTIGGTVVATGLSSNLSLNTSLNRFSFTRTLAGGPTVERVQPSIFISLTIGASYDFTIRIGYPQMEQSSFATSVIPTTTASLTRDADVCTFSNASLLIGQTEGTLYAEVDITRFIDVAEQMILQLRTDGNNRLGVAIIRSGANNNIIGFQRLAGNLEVFIQYTMPAIGIYKIAFGYKTNDYVLYVNGVQRGTDIVAGVPTSSIIDLGNQAAISAAFFNDRIRSVKIFKQRLNESDLVNLTRF